MLLVISTTNSAHLVQMLLKYPGSTLSLPITRKSTVPPSPSLSAGHCFAAVYAGFSMSVLSSQLQGPLVRLPTHEQYVPSSRSRIGIRKEGSLRKDTSFDTLPASRDFKPSLRYYMVAKASGTVPDNVADESPEFHIERLEAYTDKLPREVLCVHAEVDGEEEQVIIFKGFSSSLTGKTPDDPSDPLLLPTARIKGVDRIRAPYKPSNVEYIAEFIPWTDFNDILRSKGL